MKQIVLDQESVKFLKSVIVPGKRSFDTGPELVGVAPRRGLGRVRCDVNLEAWTRDTSKPETQQSEFDVLLSGG